MDTVGILVAAKRINELEEALIWMKANGGNAICPSEPSSFGLTFSLNSCSALRGAKQAQEQMSAQARLFAPEILAAAIVDATNTIEILRQKIAREVATDITPS